MKSRAPWFASGHPATTVSPEILKHAEAFVCKDQRITTQQLALSLTISKGRVTSSETFDIRRGSRDGFLRASQLNTELRKRPKKRPSYPTLVKQMKPGPCILNWRKKAIHGMAPPSISPELKIQKVSIGEQSWSVSSGTVLEQFFWLQCRERTQLWTLKPKSGCWQNSRSISRI